MWGFVSYYNDTAFYPNNQESPASNPDTAVGFLEILRYLRISGTAENAREGSLCVFEKNVAGSFYGLIIERMKIRLFTIPNMITLCNLLAGCAAVISVVGRHDLSWAFAFVALAAVFDFMDGFVARLTKSYSAVGKELDSLADMVSFGVAPAAVLYELFILNGGDPYWGFVVFILAACSALRLGKFNIDENQTKQFIGLPTPACALFFVSCGYLVQKYAISLPLWGIIVGTLIFSVLLICNVPMFALKFSHYRFAGNQVRYVFLAAAIVALGIAGLSAVPFIIVAYILISLIIAWMSPRS